MAGIGPTWVQSAFYGDALLFTVWSDIAEEECQASGNGAGSSGGAGGFVESASPLAVVNNSIPVAKVRR